MEKLYKYLEKIGLKESTSRNHYREEAHRLYTEGKPEEVNARMGEIMTEHGNYYNLFLQESNKATA